MGAVDTLFSQPVISGSVFARRTGFTNRMIANNMLRQLENAGVISRVRAGSGSMPAIYALPALINIAEGRTVFTYYPYALSLTRRTPYPPRCSYLPLAL